jgi:hypothetical protein
MLLRKSLSQENNLNTQVPFKNLPLIKFLVLNYIKIPTNICAIHIENSLVQHFVPVMYQGYFV